MSRTFVHVATALICLIGLPRARPAEAGGRAESGSPARAGVDKKRPLPRCVIAPIDVGLVPRVSLNALRRPCARNYLGLALGYARAGELRGVQIGLGAAAVDRAAVGVQIAIGVTAAGHGAAGLQLAGLVSAAGDDMRGIQIAGLVNAAGEDMTGLQLAGLINAAGGDTFGPQIALLGNAAGQSAAVLQVGGLFNAAGKEVRGVQLAGLFNAAGDDMRGLQISGLFNASGGRAEAIQLGGLFNAASQLRGGQVAGAMNVVEGGQGAQIALGYNRVYRELTGIQIAAVNIGRHVSGAQIGLVNIARRVDGVQLGLVNVADRASAPIGAVSWMRDGDRALEVWGGEALSLSAGVRMGTGRVYSIAGIASGPHVDGRPWGPAAGAGVKASFDRIALLIDALGHALFFDGVDDQALLAQARARVAYDVTERVAVAAGATWNVFVSGDRDGEDLPLGPDSVDRSGDTTVRQWPGLTGAVALRF